MGTVRLDDVETPTPAPETEDTPSEDLDKGEEINHQEDEPKVDEPKTDTSKADEPKVEKIKIGDKEYTVEQAQLAMEKVNRYQGDRDRAEATLEKFVANLYKQGYSVDKDFNVVPIKQEPKPQIDKSQLAQLAIAGDPEALQKLLEITQQETIQTVTNGIQRETSVRGIVESVSKSYPEFYLKDDKGEFVRSPEGALVPNENSPIFKEAVSILEKNPHLNSIQALPVLAEMAESRLFKKKFPKMEQEIIDSVHNRGKVIEGRSVLPSSPDNGTEVVQVDQAVANAGQNLGIPKDRISKVIARGQKQGGYYL